MLVTVVVPPPSAPEGTPAVHVMSLQVAERSQHRPSRIEPCRSGETHRLRVASDRDRRGFDEAARIRLVQFELSGVGYDGAGGGGLLYCD